ncbi:hypothetical protein BAUCODRAFT_124620 [Baudoinia panamericana UAMH 10762]|uniref:Uncharacterized protein n=1 Tax=Baudoinia panamericana (strain UAMH 10762) TaxID=717646 RepID=M2MQW4_BAUPA|nr:uncharacterized protein BAUCODRAFT_124620 [Baudoinia panamericana UAMH 10762]EMC93868.1 hypothetical protein BAUCODRAFT_124620 [Baudoinia panamericana UAMH 10762]
MVKTFSTGAIKEASAAPREPCVNTLLLFRRFAQVHRLTIGFYRDVAPGPQNAALPRGV